MTGSRPQARRESPVVRAAGLLRRGRLVAFPTETVYGLGADATSDDAVAAIYAAKGRPRFNPLIAHVATLEAARKLGRFDRRATALARAFWPGPLTLVLPRRKDCPVSWLASAGLPTLALRIPDHPVAMALLRATGRPVVAPSANRAGRVSPTCAADVRHELGRRVALILDGGVCRVGVESTVIDLSGTRPLLLRPGGISKAAAEAVLGERLRRAAPVAGDAARSAPGQLASHYAPRAAVRLDAADPRAGFPLPCFGVLRYALGGAPLQPPPGRLLSVAAANLFAMLRALDRSGASTIAVARIPRRGLGLAINDRLERAAAPR